MGTRGLSEGDKGDGLHVARGSKAGSRVERLALYFVKDMTHE